MNQRKSDAAEPALKGQAVSNQMRVGVALILKND
jgi:hypothetical protein